MTTKYAQEIYTRARQEVAELGLLKEDTALALINLGHSWASVNRLEREYRGEKPSLH